MGSIQFLSMLFIFTVSVGKSKADIGATYVRYGRFSCPVHSVQLYSGFAAGTYHDNTGGVAEVLCLPNDPQYDNYIDGTTGSFVYGAEYDTDWIYHEESQWEKINGLPSVFRPSNQDIPTLQDHDVPCALCYTPGRGTVYRFPAKTSCPVGWKEEYQGYLMAGHAALKTTIVPICLDKDPEVMPNVGTNQYNADFFHTKVQCGAIPCSSDGYIQSCELTCVGCTR